MKSKIEEIFDKLLIELEKGKSIEDCLKEHPQFADELRPLLLTAQSIRDLPAPRPDENTLEKTLQEVRKMLKIEAQRLEIKGVRPKFFIFQPVFVRAIAIAIFIVIVGWIGISFSRASVPGDLFYPIKIFTEKVRYTMTVNPEGQTELHIIFADKRMSELVQTYNRDRKLNKMLLSAMLNQAQLALEKCECLEGDKYICLMKQLDSLSHCQQDILVEIKTEAGGEDTLILNEAICKCCEYHSCVERKLNPDLEE